MINDNLEFSAVKGVFDWYQCTTNVKFDEFQDGANKTFKDADWRPVKASNNYHYGYQLHRGDLVLLTALFGGPNGDNVHTRASGYEARDFSNFVRNDFPVHSVTRADGALDFTEPDAWEMMQTLALNVSDKYDIKVQHFGDFHKKKDGRTLTLGGINSDVRAQIYEKGKQLDENKNWVRAEVRVRPPKLNNEQFKKNMVEPRLLASKLSPIELWGCTRWSGDLYSQLTAKLTPFISMRTWQKSNEEKAYNACLKQYQKVFDRLLLDHGSSSAVGAQIYQDLELMRQNT